MRSSFKFYLRPLFRLLQLVAALTAITAYKLFSASGLPMAPLVLALDMTALTDLWVPEVLAQGLSEPVVERNAFMDSGVVVTDQRLVDAASGPGTEVVIPFLIAPNHADQVQIEGVAPDMKKLSSGTQRAAIFNRVSPLGATALSTIISGVKLGGDLLTALLSEVKSLRKRQRQRLVIAELTGLFDVTTTPDAATGPFRANRLDKFIEAPGASPNAAYLIDSTMMLQALALLGENKELLTGGAVLMHSAVEASLSDQDQIDVIRNSEGAIVLRQWKGMTVFLSDLLIRAGGTNGHVYYTFFCGLGSIAMGDKPQVVTELAGEVAALQLDRHDVATNNVAVYDRTRFICHPQGAKWDPESGVPANVAGGPSNAELADDLNWALGLVDVKNTRIVCLRTNG
jgi:hypothetical protein